MTRFPQLPGPMRQPEPRKTFSPTTVQHWIWDDQSGRRLNYGHRGDLVLGQSLGGTRTYSHRASEAAQFSDVSCSAIAHALIHIEGQCGSHLPCSVAPTYILLCETFCCSPSSTDNYVECVCVCVCVCVLWENTVFKMALLRYN